VRFLIATRAFFQLILEPPPLLDGIV